MPLAILAMLIAAAVVTLTLLFTLNIYAVLFSCDISSVLLTATDYLSCANFLLLITLAAILSDNKYLSYAICFALFYSAMLLTTTTQSCYFILVITSSVLLPVNCYLGRDALLLLVI